MKSTERRNHVASALALALTLAAGIALADNHDRGRGIPGIAPPNSNAYGQSLAEWLSTYWRWYYLGADPAKNTVDGVRLMALPSGTQISGSGTPADPALLRGQLEISLAPGTPFVLPLFAWVWERYQGYPAVPDDVPMANSVSLSTAHPVLTIDGKTVVSDANKAAFYIPTTPFDPVVVYPAPTSYGSVEALSFQGVGVVVRPLAVGRHVIHLYEPIIIPPGAYPPLADGYGLIYDNTWIITVSPPAEVLPPQSHPFGRSYGEWSAAWWQWAMELPVNGPTPHPFVDSPAFDVTFGQSGKVWYLAAPFGTVSRNATIPSGTALFAGLLNNEASDLEGLGATEAERRATAEWYGDHIVNVQCSVDGSSVANIERFRVQSPEFSFTAPDPWIFSPAPSGAGRSVSDGYFVMLAPMSEGAHTLHYSGAFHFAVSAGDPFDADWPLDMTYHLTVSHQDMD